MPKNRHTSSNDGHPVSVIKLLREGEDPARLCRSGERTGLVVLKLTQDIRPKATFRKAGTIYRDLGLGLLKVACGGEFYNILATTPRVLSECFSN